MGCILKGGGGLYSRVAVGAVLLAAGSGSRMGHRPKSLLELGGVPLIRRQLIALSGAGVDEVVVVLGHYADRIEEAVREFPVTLVRNAQFPAKTIPELIALAKSKPGTLDCASTGIGTVQHVSLELLNQKAGIKSSLLAVPDGTRDEILAFLDKVAPLAKAHAA